MKYLSRAGICDYVDNKGVTEVWVWMYHSDITYPIESNMAMGRLSRDYWNYDGYGDISNSQRENDLPICDHTYTVYEFNYGRELREVIEDFGHQLEALLNFADDSDSKQPGDDGLFWKRWVGSEYKDGKIYNPGCGWTHYAPNGNGDYQWYNEASVLSDCEDWKPDGSGVKKSVNCHTWAGNVCSDDGGVAWKTWWMQNLPGKDNKLSYNGKPLRNWWDFIVDFDKAIAQGKKLTA